MSKEVLQRVVKVHRHMVSLTLTSGTNELVRAGEVATMLAKLNGLSAEQLEGIIRSLKIGDTLELRTRGNSVQPLRRMLRCIGWIPAPVLRKRLKKFAADEHHEILDLYARGYLWNARWRVLGAWGYGVLYSLSYPVTLVARLLRRTGG